MPTAALNFNFRKPRANKPFEVNDHWLHASIYIFYDALVVSEEPCNLQAKAVMLNADSIASSYIKKFGNYFGGIKNPLEATEGVHIKNQLVSNCGTGHELSCNIILCVVNIANNVYSFTSLAHR